MSFMAVLILLAALLLPKQLEEERLDLNTS